MSLPPSFLCPAQASHGTQKNTQVYRTEIERLQAKVAELSTALASRNQEIANELKAFIVKNSQNCMLQKNRKEKRLRCLATKEFDAPCSKELKEQPAISVQQLLHFVDIKLLHRSFALLQGPSPETHSPYYSQFPYQNMETKPELYGKESIFPVGALRHAPYTDAKFSPLLSPCRNLLISHKRQRELPLD